MYRADAFISLAPDSSARTGAARACAARHRQNRDTGHVLMTIIQRVNHKLLALF
jgi:hypothetical protein